MKCKCGCAQDFNPSRSTLFRIKQGKDSGYIPGHQAKKGKDNNKWKGGRFVSADGYIYLLKPDHPNALKKGYAGYVAEHRFVMSNHIGRPLTPEDIIHHINGDKSDNRIENLVLITRAKHASIHSQGENNGNWKGGRKPIICKTCKNSFLPIDRRTDYRAKYCSRKCFNDRNK